MLKNKSEHSVQIKQLKDFILGDNKLKCKTFFFRVEQGVMDYLDYLNDLTKVPRAQLVREAIEDQSKANIIIKKLLLELSLDPDDQKYIQKISQRIY